MKIFFTLILSFLIMVIGYGQLDKLKYDVTHFKDDINEVIYVAGRTEDNKLMVVKLDKEFTVIKELSSSFLVQEKSSFVAKLVPPSLTLIEIGKNGDELNVLNFNEELEEGKLKMENEIVNPFTGAFIKGKYIYTYGVISQLTCYERNGLEITELWNLPVDNDEQAKYKVVNVIGDNVYLCSNDEATSFDIVKFNITEKKILNRKTVKVEYEFNKCQSEIKLDPYRNRIYLAFLENKGEKGKEQHSNLTIFVLDDNLEEVFSPSVVNKVFSKSECYIKLKFGTFEDSRVTDNCPSFIVTEEGVNLQVIHATNVYGQSTRQTNSNYSVSFDGYNATVMGITDVLFFNENVKVNFYNGPTLIKCLNNFSEKSKGYMSYDFFRKKIFLNGKSIFIYRKCEGLRMPKLMSHSGRPAVFVDIENKTLLKESEKVIINTQNHFAYNSYIDYLETFQTRFIQSFKGDKILWLSVENPYKISSLGKPLKYTFVIENVF